MADLDDLTPLEDREFLDSQDLTFPYKKPYSALPWTEILSLDSLPMNKWVWASDRHYNIYPCRRIAGGMHVPASCNLPEMVKAGLVDKPVRFLPWVPDLVLCYATQDIPRLIREGKIGHG